MCGRSECNLVKTWVFGRLLLAVPEVGDAGLLALAPEQVGREIDEIVEEYRKEGRYCRYTIKGDWVDLSNLVAPFVAVANKAPR